MLDLIQNIDNQLIKIIANDFHQNVLDPIFPLVRNMFTWVPFYIIGAIWIFYKYKIVGLYWLLSLVIVVGITDSIGNYGFKKTFKRIRPCNDPLIKNDIKVLVECGSGYSFISNHAANHFAIATFIALSLSTKRKKLKYVLYFWAALIAFAQVYVGVHYVSDIIAGAIVGIIIANLINKLIPLKFKLRID